MNITNMKITDIHPYEKNLRFNDDAVETVAKSLKEFGWQLPIVVDKDHVIIVGHTRLKAAGSLGLTEVPVVVADNLTPEQVQAYRIADNKTGEIAEWNYNLLPVGTERFAGKNNVFFIHGLRSKRYCGFMDFSIFCLLAVASLFS